MGSWTNLLCMSTPKTETCEKGKLPICAEVAAFRASKKVELRDAVMEKVK